MSRYSLVMNHIVIMFSLLLIGKDIIGWSRSRLKHPTSQELLVNQDIKKQTCLIHNWQIGITLRVLGLRRKLSCILRNISTIVGIMNRGPGYKWKNYLQLIAIGLCIDTKFPPYWPSLTLFDDTLYSHHITHFTHQHLFRATRGKLVSKIDFRGWKICNEFEDNMIFNDYLNKISFILSIFIS